MRAIILMHRCSALLQHWKQERPSDTVHHPPDGFSAFLDTLHLPEGGHLKQRAQAISQNSFLVDPVDATITDLVRGKPRTGSAGRCPAGQALAAGRPQPVAIVTEDRRLARRVRAMLEASGIQLDDPAGWALSTTSAAAIVERWLETVEEDFACGPMLDVLKSPFYEWRTRDQHLALVLRLEQDIILHENIARGLDRYRRHLDLRSNACRALDRAHSP